MYRAHVGGPYPLPIWSINYIHFKSNIFKNEQFLSSSFEMADICILLTIKIVLKSAKIDYSKIQKSAISKLPNQRCSFLNMLLLKYIYLIDQIDSGQVQPTWALYIPRKLLYYTSKMQNGGYFCVRLYIENRNSINWILRHSWHWKSKWNNFHSLFVLVNFLAEHNHRHFYFKILPEANSCEASFVEAPFQETLSHPKMKFSIFQIARIKMSFPHFWGKFNMRILISESGVNMYLYIKLLL